MPIFDTVCTEIEELVYKQIEDLKELGTQAKLSLTVASPSTELILN